MSVRRPAVVFSLLATLLLGACASVPMAPPEEDARAKQAAPPPGKAQIFVYRSETLGGAHRLAVKLDGRAAGQTAPKTYFRFVASPGSHTLHSEGEGGGSTLTLNCAAGKSYYVWQEIKMGFIGPSTKLQQVDEATGRAAVKDCGLIKANF
jgi:hypothetical protein